MMTARARTCKFPCSNVYMLGCWFPPSWWVAYLSLPLLQSFLSIWLKVSLFPTALKKWALNENELRLCSNPTGTGCITLRRKDFHISSKIMPNKTETRLLWPPSHAVFKQESRGGEKGVVLPLLFPPSSSNCAFPLSSTSNPLADIAVASFLSVPRLPYFFHAPPPSSLLCCPAGCATRPTSGWEGWWGH